MSHLQGTAIIGKNEAWRKTVTSLVKSEGANILYSGDDDELARILVLAGEVDRVVFTDPEVLFTNWYESLKTAITENGHSLVHNPPAKNTPETQETRADAELTES